MNWYKRSKYLYPSWGNSLYNYPGDRVSFTQRQENMFRFGRKKVKTI